MNERLNTTIAHYNSLIQRGGEDHQVTGWGSRNSQERRFTALIGVAHLTGKSVLDVGCGLGSLYGFLNKKGINCRYKGIDINQNMIAGARERFPNGDFNVMDILALTTPFPKFDFTFLSGALNLGQDRIGTFVLEMIDRMWQLTTKAVSFNMLSSRGKMVEPGEYIARPGAILDFCLGLSRKVVLRHDYMPHDFTVYIYRDD